MLKPLKEYNNNKGLKMKKLLILFLSLAINLGAQNAPEIIQKVEDNLNGKTAFLEITMIIKTSRYERKMQMFSWSKGNDKSFIKITYPKKDRGITFLKIDNQMWQYVPKIERVIKIPSSMMLQSWMGSDFTNDDLVKESSIMEDYNSKIVEQNTTLYTIELIPKEDAAVVWGKIIMQVDKELFLPISASYYDEDEKLIRTLSYKKFKKFSNRTYPTEWKMISHTKQTRDHQTIIIIENAEFDKDIDSSYFTKRALKRYSK